MKEPKVLVKNVKTFRGMEGYGVNASVWINGKLACTAIDSADGGEMYFEPNYKHLEQSKALIKELEDYCAAQPKRKITDTLSVKFTMEDYVNDLLVKWEDEKNKQKIDKLIKKHSKTAIVFGKPNTGEIRMLNFHVPLSNINRNVVEMHLRETQKKYCIDGVVILNTNLNELGITL